MIGSGIGGLTEIETQHERLLHKGPDKVSAFTIPKLIANSASGQVSIQWGLAGAERVHRHGLRSAANSIGKAFRTIQCGDADVMITGGSEAAAHAAWAWPVLPPCGPSPSATTTPPTPAGPSIATATASSSARGRACWSLKNWNMPKPAARNIYAEIIGYGMSADGGHITQPDKDGIGAAHAMRLAVQDAGINAAERRLHQRPRHEHAAGRRGRESAIKSVFGCHAEKLSVSSTKSQLGHLLGASGGMELIFSILAIRDSVIPPTINYETPDPACDLDCTPNQARQRA